MRWIAFLSLTSLLTACIYTEGTPIIEPQDVVVSQQAHNCIAMDDYLTSTDVTKAK